MSLFLYLFSLAVCQFSSRGDQEWYVVVGTAKDLILTPRSSSGGSLIVFKLSPDGGKLEHVHTVILTSSNDIFYMLLFIDTIG